MTNLESLKEEMLRRGLTKSQCNSQIAAVVLDVALNTGSFSTDEWKLKSDIKQLEEYRDKLEEELKSLRSEINRERTEQEKYTDDLQAYVDQTLKKLETFETKEGQDRFKLAQLFINTVKIKSAYDNTAFITGLAAILSSGEVAPVDELKKINKKVPGYSEIKHLFAAQNNSELSDC